MNAALAILMCGSGGRREGVCQVVPWQSLDKKSDIGTDSTRNGLIGTSLSFDWTHPVFEIIYFICTTYNLTLKPSYHWTKHLTIGTDSSLNRSHYWFDSSCFRSSLETSGAVYVLWSDSSLPSLRIPGECGRTGRRSFWIHDCWNTDIYYQMLQKDHTK